MQVSEIEEVIATQKKQAAGQSLGVKRDALEKLPPLKNHALIITGIRRCGKSTLLRQYAWQCAAEKDAGGCFYLNFEDLRLADFRVSDYRVLDALIAKSGDSTLLLDEVQTAPMWEAWIRQKLDEGCKVVATGSNAHLLSRELGTKLTGRHITKELFPFSYGEFLRFARRKPNVKSLEQYLQSGGFPEYLRTGHDEALSQLQQDILYRDIAVRYGLRDALSLKRLFAYLLSNAGRLISPSKLTNIAGVKSHTTVLEYLSYFEAAYLIQLAPCFAWSVKKQDLAPKKAYVIDTGFIRIGSTSFSPDRGVLLENFVFNTLRNRSGDIFYFADKSGECDFVFEPHGGAPLCLQVCWELTLDNRGREINGLLRAMDFLKTANGVIVTRNQRDTAFCDGKQIDIVPAWDWRIT